MSSYPSKPWSDGQTHEVVPGETFVYDASQGIWTHVTKATLDSDFQVDKAVLETDITAVENRATALEGRATTLEGRADNDSDRATVIEADLAALGSRVDTIELLSDSEASRVQANIDTINVAMSMLDSDGVALQAIRTDFEAADAALQISVDAHTTKFDVDSDRMTAIEASIVANDNLDAVTVANHDSDLANLPMPVISVTPPAGVTGQLWVNMTDGKLYYWNDSDAFISIVST